MYSKKSNPRKYPKRFNEIYFLSKDFSAKSCVNFDEVFNEAVRFHDPRYSLDRIWDQLRSKRFQGTSRMNINASNTNYRVWLAFGETGQGKSTFTNVICGAQVAVEGKGIKSKTEKIDLHTSHKHKIIMIDTPGLFDTRRIKNREISNKIVEIVENKLRQNAHIDAIFFLWCPTSSMRLRFEEILATLKKALGDEAIDSVVFIVNQVTSRWDEDCDARYEEFLDMLDEKGLDNPVFESDLKEMTAEDIQELKKRAKKVDPYREEDFEAHRMMIYFNKFLEIQKIDEEKEREREAIEKEKEILRRQNRELEIRLEKEKAEREAEEKRRKEEDERRRKEEEERIRQEEQRHREEEERIRQEEQRHREEEERIRHEQRCHEEERTAQYYYPSYSHPFWSYSSSSYDSTPISTPTQTATTSSPSTSTDGMKFYKGGQYISGAYRVQAPKGGCYRPAPSSSSRPANSSKSGRKA
jgi:predicted GTPase